MAIPVAGELARSMLSLPVHPGVGVRELEQVCDAVNGLKEAGR
jgi:dTDP-4-amino-4,6-dideoxygalactose transaminase